MSPENLIGQNLFPMIDYYAVNGKAPLILTEYDVESATLS